MTLDSAPRTHRFINVDVLTQSFRVVGKILVNITGALGLLNDTNNSFFEVHDAKMARLHMPTKLVDHFEVMRLVKAHVFAACLARREDIGPQAMARGGYNKVVEYPVRIASQVYEMEGTIEWPGRFEFSAIMVEGTADFMAIYNARLTAILIPNLRIESPGMLFNRRQVDMLGQTTMRVKPQ